MDETVKQKQTGRTRNRILIIVAVVAALLLGGFLSLSLVSPDDVIASNLVVRGVDVGGMTLEEAQTAIDQAGAFDKLVLVLKNGDRTHNIAAADISLGIDAQATAQKAFAICKSGNPFRDAFDQLCLFFGRRDVEFVPTVNTEVLDAALYAFGAEINGEMTAHQVTVADSIATITPGRTGQNPDMQKTREEVLSAVAKEQYTNIPVTLETIAPEQLTVESAYALLYSEPKTAEYQYDGNVVTVSESTVGCDVDKALLPELIEKVNSGMVATVPVTVTIPENTAEDLQAKLFNATLASYSTTFSTAAANRADNVALAARKINDVVLAPGQVFSYAEVLGNPSLANGFKVAPVYENGKTSQGVGGGVCQVSSTLYSAVLYADLEVVYRQNHSLTVAYLPKGQDATFAYGAIDFKFKNNMEYPVKVSAVTNGGKLTVSIIGTKRDVERTVQLSHKIVSTTEPTVKQTEDPTLPAGTQQVVSTGKTGYVVDTTKTVYENGNVVSSGVITRSTYKMVPTEMVVGPQIEPTVSVPGTETPLETPTPADGGTTPAPEQPQPDTPVKPPANTPAATQAPVESPAPTTETVPEEPAV